MRQNYVDQDIGDDKATAIGRRLAAIRPDVAIEIVEVGPDLPDSGTYDLVIDASVHHAVGLVLNDYPRGTELAQVATDTRTGTLGLVIVRSSGDPRSMNEVDEAVGALVAARRELEVFSEFWSGSADGGVVPTLGCSIPTFHGSAADMAGIASTAVSLIAGHLLEPISGGHVFALPYAVDVKVQHEFLLAENPSPDAEV